MHAQTYIQEFLSWSFLLMNSSIKILLQYWRENVQVITLHDTINET